MVRRQQVTVYEMLPSCASVKRDWKEQLHGFACLVVFVVVVVLFFVISKQYDHVFGSNFAGLEQIAPSFDLIFIFL